MKKLLAIVLAVLMLVSLCACSGITDIINGNGDGDDNGTTTPEDFKTPEEIEEYFDNILISYQYTSTETQEEGVAWTVAQNDKAVYVNIMGIQMLYVKDTGESFMFDDQGQKIKYSTTETMSFSDYTDMFFDYTYDTEDFVRTGTKTIAGRTCTVYEYSISVFGYTYSSLYSIDNATGICMEVSVSGSAGGESGSVTWIVTELQVGGVNLDEYINQPVDIDYTQYE
ncbi:MAG: hypothetical protein PHI78_01300 [Clostridia bacterium]|nr:hypothetical protein [Clostridia bacterium]